MDELDACLRRYGVPRLPSDLGLTADEFAAAVAHAPSTRPDRFTILEHLDLDDGMVRAGSTTSSAPSIAELRAVTQPSR